MNTVQNETYRNELKEWDNALEFYSDEIRVFENRLREVVSKNTNPVLLARVEQFQNQFILQKEQFDHLLHDIHELKENVEKGMIKGSRQATLQGTVDQEFIREKVEMAEKIFRDTRRGFYRFLSEVL